jgi:hypothetical protein
MQRIQPEAGGGSGSRPTVLFEIASTSSEAVLGRSVAAVQEDTSQGRWYAEEQLDLAAFPPGAYEVRAVVSVDGKEAGRISRRIVTGTRPQAASPEVR